MALTGVALAGTQGMHSSARAEFVDNVTVTLDASYPAATGGYPTFGTTLAGVIGNGKTIMFVIPTSACGGYRPVYNRATNKLQIYQGAAGLGPDTEVPNGTDLHLITCELAVFAV